MTAANVPNPIVNLTPADAVPVDQNFTYLQTFLNSEMINRDGSVAMSAPLTLAEDPTQAMQAATKHYADSLFPVGAMIQYGGTTAPAGNWMLAQGQAMSTSSFPTLFGILGYRYGGSGSTFNLPDMRGRVPIGKDVAVTDINETGKVGGSINVPLLAHIHSMGSHTHSIAHDHPEVTSGYISADHSHTINHTHAAENTATVSSNHTHNYSGTTAAGGAHSHTVDARLDPISGSLGSLGVSNAGGTINTRNTSTSATHTHTYSGTTGYISDNHHHYFQTPAYAGSSGGASANHTHQVDLGNYTGNSGTPSAADTGSTGEATPTQRQPFAVVNYIIRTQ